MVAISRAEADRVSFAAGKKGGHVASQRLAIFLVQFGLGREGKKIHSGQGFHLSRVKSGTMVVPLPAPKLSTPPPPPPPLPSDQPSISTFYSFSPFSSRAD